MEPFGLWDVVIVVSTLLSLIECVVACFDCRVPFAVPLELQPPVRRDGQGRRRLPLPARSSLEIRLANLLPIG